MLKLRQTPLSKRLEAGARAGGLIDIPHFDILNVTSAEQIVSQFQHVYGTRPEGVVLPCVAPDGLLYPVQGFDYPLSSSAKDDSGTLVFIKAVRGFLEEKLPIYVSIDPSLNFVTAQTIHIVDTLHESSSQVCISNQQAQEIIASILMIGIDLVLEETRENGGILQGVVIDAVDLLPMGAKESQLNLTCFCPTCRQFFENKQPGLLSEITQHPSPWNIFLTDNGTGIGFIDEIPTNATDQELLEMSNLRGYLKVFGKEAEDVPQMLARVKQARAYMRLRHNLIVDSLTSIFDMALEGDAKEFHSIKRILILEGCFYGWTSGIQLERLDVRENSKFQEIWYDLQEEPIELEHIPYRAFLWARSRYFIDAFFQTLAHATSERMRATTGIARLSSEKLQKLLNTRLEKVLGTSLVGEASLVALPPSKKESGDSLREGYIVPMLTREIGEVMLKKTIIVNNTPEDDEDDPSEMLRDLLRRIGGRS